MNGVDTTILSLGTGLGGLDLGLVSGLRGMGQIARAVCMVEREAACVAILASKMQKGDLAPCPIWLGDVATLPKGCLRSVDWITAGYPCQPFSSAGQRKGAEHESYIWPVIRETLEDVRPAGVFFENVTGHISMGVREVLSDLERLGFICSWGLFRAEQIGAPHRRERVFILGMADPNKYSQPDLSKHEKTPRLCSLLDFPDGARQRGRELREHRPHQFPARPGCTQRPYEPPRTTQPGLGRDAHGVPSRVDRLRALGNSVVPQQAKLAFETLAGGAA